ncbi:MAG: transketolase C-terminal domain-containing protein, partial [Bacillota bacterium]
FEQSNVEDADILIVGHGVVTRALRGAVQELRAEGVKAGLFRPITLRPFPAEQMKAAMQNAKTVLIVESAFGQLAKLIKDDIYGSTVKLEYLFKPGVGVTAEEVVAKVKSLA